MAQAEMTLNEIAKQLVINEENMDTIIVNQKIKKIADLMTEKYYMLFCPDLRQYVVLHINDKENICGELLSIFSNRGQMLLIDDDNEDKQIWEFWVKDIYDGEPHVYQLTPYEVVEV